MTLNQQPHTNLPVKRDLTLMYILSTIIAVLMASAAITGLLYRTSVYPTDDLLHAFVPNDVVNLFIGLPTLLGSIWLARRGRLIGLLFWPGALFFALYNYLIYVLAMPLNIAFLLCLTLVMLSVYTLIGLVASIDGRAVQQQLTGAVPQKLAGGILTGLGCLFLLWALSVIVNGLSGETALTDTVRATNMTDFIIAPAWIIGGVLLWRREALGYVAGVGSLFQASMLFIGLIVFILVQPLLTTEAFAYVDLIVVFVMGLICFVPFALFVRGVVSNPDANAT